MRRAFFALVLLVFLSGCTARTGTDNITSTSANMPTPASADFAETKRIINALYDDKLIIGEDRYSELKGRLDTHERDGIGKDEIPSLRVKLDALKPQGTQTNQTKKSKDSELDILEQEINGIIESKLLVGPDHYQRMLNDLNSISTDKIRVEALRKKLETLNPDNLESVQQVRQNPDDKILAALPECAGQKFTVFPVDQMQEITPIGNMGPPGHTFPTDHMYIHISGGRATTATVPLKSPGEVYLLSITPDPDDIAPERTEYSIGFALCKDVFGYFHHVKGISDQLKTWMQEASCEGIPEPCPKRLFQKISAGTAIGEVGHLQGNFDFGAYDYRKQLAFANISRYGDPLSFTGLWRPRALYIVCPLDLYEGSVKEQSYNKVAGSNNPKCGKTLYDIKGTLQGNWFYGNSRADTGPNSGHLSFVYDNQDPNKAVVSIGGTISNAGKMIFTPQMSGVNNRRFDEVTPDGKVYCFSDSTNKVLVSMTNTEQISVEHVQGTCGYSESLSNPYTYRR